MTTVEHPPSETNAGMTKIRISLPEDAWHGIGAEWVWTLHLKDDIFALRNVPFYAMGVSYDDQVKVSDREGAPTMLGVVSRGGHSTYRVFAKQGHLDERVQSFFTKLNALHCDIEVATEKLAAIDVLPEADIHRVYSALEEAEKNGVIDFQEGHCGHPLASRPQ